MTCLQITHVDDEELYAGRLRVRPRHSHKVIVLGDKMVVTDDLPAPLPTLIAQFGRNEETRLVVIGESCSDEGLAWWRTLSFDGPSCRTFRLSSVGERIAAVYEEVKGPRPTRRGRRGGRQVRT
jgi:hypothetical protein